jgi:hypothetical protein
LAGGTGWYANLWLWGVIGQGLGAKLGTHRCHSDSRRGGRAMALLFGILGFNFKLRASISN